MIKIPGVDYTDVRQVPVKPDINPTDNPDDFWPMNVKVDVHDMVIDATNLKKVTVTVSCQKANYSEEFTIEKKILVNLLKNLFLMKNITLIYLLNLMMVEIVDF